MTVLMSRLSLSAGWEDCPKRGLKCSVRPQGHRQPSIINMVAHINSDKIVAGTSPTIKRSLLIQVYSATSQPVHTIPAGSKGTGSATKTGAPRILLKDVFVIRLQSMSLDYDLGTMTATTQPLTFCNLSKQCRP